MANLSGNPTAVARSCSLLPCLPPELIIRIIEYIPPHSHFNFALTCRRLADCAQDVLRRHAIAHQEYRVASDRDPATVVTLLRSTFGFGDPIPAWHVRSFESWDLRRLVAHDAFPDPPLDGPYRYEDGFDWEWHEGEVNTYVSAFKEAAFDADDLDALRRDLRDQHDGALKMVLFTTLPRLRDIKLARSDPANATGRLAPHQPYACLSWLHVAIANGMHQTSRAPGLCGLESLAVGVNTRDYQRFSDSLAGRPNPTRTSGELLLQLMRLPRLSSLYFNGLSTRTAAERHGKAYSQSQYHQGGIYNPAPGSSAVEHLYLDGMDSSCGADWVYPIAIAPSNLRSVALRSDESTADAICCNYQNFLKIQRRTLDSMMVYSPDYFIDHNGNLIDPREVVDTCQARQFTYDVWDYCRGSEPNTLNLKGFVRRFRQYVARSLEVLVLHGDEHLFDFEHKEIAVDEAVAAHLDSGEHILKTVYLCDFEYFPKDKWLRYREEVRFQKAIVAGIRCGVDVITRTTRREDLINPEPSFPRAVDQYDLMTGPFGGQRPPRDKGRLFDPLDGTQDAELCDHCGECEECLELYPPELWKRTREIRAWAMAMTERGEWTEQDKWTMPEYPDEEEEEDEVDEDLGRLKMRMLSQR